MIDKRAFAYLLVLALCFFSCLTSSFADTPFYQGKTITIVQSTEPGGSGDVRT